MLVALELTLTRVLNLCRSSGAGKSTLMDVIAGRKSSGTVLGEVRLNGFLQDPMSFRRASGYVEQFDVQSPELTVLETVEFSAKLRIDRELVENEEDIHNYVEAVLRDVELDDLAEALVGDDEGSGLSFEQKKRLSIAVELAASPSIIFVSLIRYESECFIRSHTVSHPASCSAGRADQWLGCEKCTFGSKNVEEDC